MRLKPSQILYWGCFLGLLAIDQIVKAQVRAHYAVGESRTLLPALLDLRLTYNEGIAFGKLQGFGVYLAPVAIVIAVFAGIYSARHPEESRWTHAAMGLLASGALGNMLDRILWHRVTDMFEFRFVQFPVFNVADACITVAAAILIVKWGLEALHPAPKLGSGIRVDIPPEPTTSQSSTESSNFKKPSFVTEEQMNRALEVQQRSGTANLGQVLVELGMVGEREIAMARAQELGHNFVDLDRYQIESDALSVVSAVLVKDHQIIPVKKDGTNLYVAIADPINTQALDDVGVASGCRVIPVLALPAAIAVAIGKYYSADAEEA